MKKTINYSNIIFILLIGIGVFYYLYLKGLIFSNFHNIEPVKAYNLLQKEKDRVVLLDVRTPEEVNSDGKIPDSILIPLDELPNKIDLLPKDKKIIVYCRSGIRSVSASRLLSSLGYDVYNLSGGLKNWKSQNLPITK